MIFKKRCMMFLSLFLMFIASLLHARDILVEAKGSVFVPTNATFKEIYHTCGDAGLEFTGHLFNNLYGFVSVDLIVKHGETVLLDSPTKAIITNLGFGLKYFVPFEHGDFYVGLGVEPTYLCTLDDSPFVPSKNDQWSCGLLSKIGVIIDLPHSFFTDIFFNYSFAEYNFSSSAGSLTEAHNAILNGCLFGIGFGYRFH